MANVPGVYRFPVSGATVGISRFQWLIAELKLVADALKQWLRDRVSCSSFYELSLSQVVVWKIDRMNLSVLRLMLFEKGI